YSVFFFHFMFSTYISSFFFLTIRRPPRSTLFPTRRSSDLILRLRRKITWTSSRKRADRSACHRLRPHCGSPDAAASRENATPTRSEEHTSELQSRGHLVCRLLLEKKKKKK